MHEALVEHAKHQIDGDDRRENQQWLARQRLLEDLGAALKTGSDAGGHANAGERGVNRLGCLPDRHPGCEIE